jgi:hypothetical protein
MKKSHLRYKKLLEKSLDNFWRSITRTLLLTKIAFINYNKCFQFINYYKGKGKYKIKY